MSQRGWPLLPVPDEHGRLRYPSSVSRSVAEKIQVILSTRPGEQLLRPRFGAGLDQFVSEPDSERTRARIRSTIVAQLARHEPRIRLDDVDITAVPGARGQLRIELFYTIARTGEPQRLGLTMTTGTP